MYPCLLRDLKVDRACQVWAVDITYIPLENGFCYLAAIIDWHSRKVLSWGVVGHSIRRFTTTGPIKIECVTNTLANSGFPSVAVMLKAPIGMCCKPE